MAVAESSPRRAGTASATATTTMAMATTTERGAAVATLAGATGDDDDDDDDDGDLQNALREWIDEHPARSTDAAPVGHNRGGGKATWQSLPGTIQNNSTSGWVDSPSFPLRIFQAHSAACEMPAYTRVISR